MFKYMKILAFFTEYHDIEVKTISRSNITITINIIILCSSIKNIIIIAMQHVL